MSYRCGIGPGMEKLGLEPGPPRVTCDGCGKQLPAVTKTGGPPMWLLNGKAPKGWLLIRHEEPKTGAILREDYCPACRQEKGKGRRA
jgi:hypothetical protein